MLLKQSFLRHFELIDFRLSAARYAVSAVSALEVILLPLLIDPSLYAGIEKNRQILSFLPLALLGSSLGYIKVYFDGKSERAHADLFNGALISAFFAALLIFTFTSLISFAIATFLFILCTATERIAFVNGNLILATIYKGIISIFVLALFVFIKRFYSNSLSLDIYFVSVCLGCTIWLIIISYRIINIRNLIFQNNFSFAKKYYSMISEGFFLNALTYAIVLYLMVDRRIIEHFYPSSHYHYALSFSLSQLSLILINTIAYSFLYKMGDEQKIISFKNYKTYRTTAVFSFFFVYICGMIGGYIYLAFIVNAEDALYIYSIVSFFLGLYFAISAATVLALYLDLARAGLAIFVASIALNLVISPGLAFGNWPVEIYLVKSGVILTLSAVALDFLIVRRLKARGEDKGQSSNADF
jgi:hypothetical protein